MYNPPLFAESRIEELHAFIRQHSLAAIVTSGSDGLEATHVPVVLHPRLETNGVLRCHLARANPHWKSLQAGAPVLAIFQGPEHYISPSWYPSKQEHGKVVPTWNYAVVHVRGRASTFEDPEQLLQHLRTLTDQNESGADTPWSVDDAPADYIQALAKTIIGIEIAIETIEGKWKVSQNRPAADRQGVVAGLLAIDSPESVEMAKLVKERNPKT
ncbi:MAG TPA: FMN-binding negative transcriptional regulator [Bryobacteraceae bacterium]|jgi:transcriptional regulator|nr:FMN-binding negative transcriptional regulator [Bryobacteraceae bacterium]